MKTRNRSDCPYRIGLGYDYSCGAYEAHCNLAPERKEHSLYCIHEGNPLPCPMEQQK